MTHGERLLVALAGTYAVAIASAFFLPSLAIEQNKLGKGFLLLSGLVGILVLYCTILILRTYLLSQQLSAWFSDRVLGALVAGVAISGETSMVSIGYSSAIFVALLVFAPETLLDTEVEIRRTQVMREVGLNPDKPMPFVALLLFLALIVACCAVWLKAV